MVRAVFLLLLLLSSVAPAPSAAQDAGANARANGMENWIILSGLGLYEIEAVLPMWQRTHDYDTAELAKVTVYLDLPAIREPAPSLQRLPGRIAFEDGNFSPNVVTVFIVNKHGAISQTVADSSGWTRVPGYYVAAISAMLAFRGTNPPREPVDLLSTKGDGVLVGLWTDSMFKAYKIDIQQMLPFDKNHPMIGCGPNERYIVAQSDYSVTHDAPCI